MGRYGSGRNTTDDYVRLDVRWCERHGYLQPGRAGTMHWSRRGECIAAVGFETAYGQLVLRYRLRQGEEWQHKHYSIAVEWTPCPYGGNRAWLHCPCCCHRVAVLYLSGVFTCRHCLHLAYKSQQEAPHDRALRKAQKIHERLGGTGILVDSISKPKGMHWRTYFLKVERMYKAEICAVPPWLLRFEAKQ